MFQSNQHVPLCPPHRANFVWHQLDPRIAIMPQTFAAAEIVLRVSHSRVSLTQLLGMDAGSRHCALQKAVAAKVSVEEQTVPVCQFLSLPQVL